MITSTAHPACRPDMGNVMLTAQNLLIEAYKFASVSIKGSFMRPDFNSSKNIVSKERLEELSEETGEIGRFDRPALQPRILTRGVIEGLARFAEFSLITLTGLVIWAIRLEDFSAQSVLAYIPVIGFIAISVTLLANMAGAYKIHALLNPLVQLPRLAAIWSGVFLVIMALVFFSKAGIIYSRVWLASYMIGGLLLLTGWRFLVSRLTGYLNRSGRLDLKAALVGGGKPAGDLINSLAETPHCGVSVAGIFDDRSDERSPAIVNGCKKLGSVADLVRYARQSHVDMLIINFPVAAEDRILQVLHQLWVLPVDIRLNTYAQKLRYRPRAYSHIGNMSFLDLFDRPLTGWKLIAKEIEDKVLAGIFLILAAPVMALVALAIRLDSPGPVLFRQKRYGFNNELINVYKFRSMYAHMNDARAERLTARNDPRVTRVGRFIRKTSLDELPQLFNVLKGELSLVGPRPHPTAAKARDMLYWDAFDGYFARHKVKPGITGWAQINGWRGETDTREKLIRRVEHDLYYIENWSLLFDLYILARTPRALLNTENAY